MAVTFKGRGRRLDDIDLPRIGQRIGVGEDEIHPVLDVEAAGSSFDDKGRVKGLHEPHNAYREADKLKDKTVLNALVKAGLCATAIALFRIDLRRFELRLARLRSLAGAAAPAQPGLRTRSQTALPC